MLLWHQKSFNRRCSDICFAFISDPRLGVLHRATRWYCDEDYNYTCCPAKCKAFIVTVSCVCVCMRVCVCFIPPAIEIREVYTVVRRWAVSLFMEQPPSTLDCGSSPWWDYKYNKSTSNADEEDLSLKLLPQFSSVLNETCYICPLWFVKLFDIFFCEA